MPIYSFLPYLDKDLGKFHGISKVIPSNKDEKHYQIYQEDFAKRKEENNLYSQIGSMKLNVEFNPMLEIKLLFPINTKDNIMISNQVKSIILN